MYVMVYTCTKYITDVCHGIYMNQVYNGCMSWYIHEPRFKTSGYCIWSNILLWLSHFTLLFFSHSSFKIVKNTKSH